MVEFCLALLLCRKRFWPGCRCERIGVWRAEGGGGGFGCEATGLASIERGGGGSRRCGEEWERSVSDLLCEDIGGGGGSVALGKEEVVERLFGGWYWRGSGSCVGHCGGMAGVGGSWLRED